MRAAAAVTLLAVACGGSPQTALLTLRAASDVPPVDQLDELSLEWSTCSRNQSFDLGTQPGASVELGLSADPGAWVSAWVRGAQICAEEGCVEAALAGPSDCVCGAPATRVVAEGCTSWVRFEDGLELNLRLAPPNGACPAPSPCEP